MTTLIPKLLVRRNHIVPSAPLDVSCITDYLYIAALPNKNHVEAIKALNVRLVISMIMEITECVDEELGQPPLHLLRLRTTDAFYHPIYPTKTLCRGAEAARAVIREGHSVLVFCTFGRHRSPAMASCILIGMGYSADDAMRLVSEQRPVADLNPRIRKRIKRFEAEFEQQVSNP